MKRLITVTITLILLLPIISWGATFFAKNFSKMDNDFTYTNPKNIENVSLTSKYSVYTNSTGYANKSNRIYLLDSNDIRTRSKGYLRPPLNTLRISGEIAGGSLGGLGGGVFFAIFGSFLGADETSEGLPPASEKHAKIAFLIGWPFSTACCIHAIGNIGDETGSLLWTLGGSTLGAALSIGLISIFADIDNFIGPNLYLFSIFPAIGGTVAFNLTRQYKTSTKYGTGLINFENDQINLSIPNVYLQSDPFDKKKVYKKIDLLTIRFK